MAKHNVTVKLIGHDGNAFAIMARVTRALRKSGVSQKEIDDYTRDAMSGDYDNLLRVTMNTVNVK